MATGRGCQEPDALPAAGQGTRCSLLPSTVLCKSDFCGVVTPPCPLEGPLHRRGKPSPACSELRAPSSSSSSPSIRPSPHEPRAGAEAAGGKPLAWGPGADANGGAWSRRAARASPSPGARFLAAATGSHSNTRKSRGLAGCAAGAAAPHHLGTRLLPRGVAGTDLCVRSSRRRAQGSSSPGSGVRAPRRLRAPGDLQAGHVVRRWAVGGAAAAGPPPHEAFPMALLLPERPQSRQGTKGFALPPVPPAGRLRC